MKNILIIDDEMDIRNNIKAILEDENYNTQTASDSSKAMKLIKENAFDLIILDVWLDDSELDGLETLKLIREDYPYLPVIIISGHGNIDMAVKAIKEGAYEFIEKPFKTERLLLSISRTIEMIEIKNENQFLKERNIYDYKFIGESLVIQKIKQLIQKVSPTSSRVLIYGDSGTGKDLIAREIHKNSNNANGPFVVINAAIMQPDGIETALFGGESNGKIVSHGLFEKSNNGTLFIDEVGEMPLQTQAKILRVLTDQALTRVGGNQQVKINTRIICSSTKDLEELIDQGNFRKDLYHRLNVVNIKLPRLAERLEDIEQIIDYFADYYSTLNSAKLIDLKPMIKSKYINYNWPGNIRELRNIVERQVILGDKFDDSINEFNESRIESKNVISMPLKNARKIFEKNYLISQIQRFNGNISKTAIFIGMERSALHRKLKQLGISEEDKS